MIIQVMLLLESMGALGQNRSSDCAKPRTSHQANVALHNWLNRVGDRQVWLT